MASSGVRSDSSGSTDVFEVDDESLPFNPSSVHSLLQSAAWSESSARVDYMDTLGSRPEAEWSSRWGTFDTALHRSSIQNSLERRVRHEEMIGRQMEIEREEEEQRKQIEKTVLEVIAIHMLVLCLVHIVLQVLLLVCGRFCPSEVLLHRIELGVVLTFPVLCLLALRILDEISGKTLACAVLLLAYSATFAVFFFSACDLVFGNMPIRRDAALMLFTLTVSLFLFSMFAMTNRVSVRQRYVRLAFITLVISLVIGLPLVMPQTILNLPRGVQKLLEPDLPSSALQPVWPSYAMAALFALMSVTITSVLLFTLRQNMYDRNHIAEYVRTDSGLDEISLNAASITLQTLVTVELFFLVLPYQILKELSAMFRCSYRRR